MKVSAMVTKKEFTKEEISSIICSSWEPLTSYQRSLLFRNISVEKFKKNELIYKDQEVPSMMMFLVQGKVKVIKEGKGHCQIIRVIKPTEFFGYRAFFAHESFQASAMAFEPSVVALIPMTVIMEILPDCHGMAQSIIQHLSVELGKSDNRIISLTQKHIRGRLAEALIVLKDCYGLEDDGTTLNIYLSREDLANLSNMTTSNAIRTLSTFASEKLVAIDGRKIKILQETELRRISRIG